jgi:hypothetical protein
MYADAFMLIRINELSHSIYILILKSLKYDWIMNEI